MEVKTAERASERPVGLDAQTACEAFQLTAEAHPDRVAIRTKGDEFSCSWGEYADRVRSLAAGLAALGVAKGDTVALMMVNRPEFHFADAAAMHLGAVPFSIYNTYTADEIQHLVNDAGSAVAIVEQGFADKILAARDAADALEHVIVVDGEAPEGTMSLDDLASRGSDDFDFEGTWRGVEPDDLLTLIYTSGTTGHPKGVQIMHSNICETVRSYDEMIRFPDGGRIVSYLPMAHVAERNVSHYLPMLCGFTITCCPDARKVIEYLPEVKPTWFFAVPRIWEKLKADVEIFANLRNHLGLDELEACNVGAAPTPPEVIEFFHALGIPLAELWGMSETTGAGTCNPPERIKIGTVGPA